MQAFEVVSGSAASTPAFQPEERRAHPRIKTTLKGRYMLESGAEYPCTTLDVSLCGLALQAPNKAPVGTRVVVYLDTLGRLEGQIARNFADGFAITFKLPLIKRERLASQLSWMANKDALGLPDARRHARIVPDTRQSVLRLNDGHTLPCHIIDVSVSGVGLALDTHLPVGTPITVGRTPGRVVRTFAGGLAVEFSHMFAADRFDRSVVL